MIIEIDGLPAVPGHYLKAILKWTLEASPKPTPDDDSLSHVILTTDLQIIACDGERWHCGCLPPIEGLDFPRSFPATRSSVEGFHTLLAAAAKIVGKQAPFPVYLDTRPDGDPGLRAIVECDGELWRWEFKRALMTGPVPERWIPPVSEDAAIVSDLSQFRSMDLSKATALDDAITQIRQAEKDGPLRLDFFAFVPAVDDTMRVATAVILPAGTKARFMSEQQAELFSRERPGEVPGRSVLSMVIDCPKGVERPGRPVSPDAAVDDLLGKGAAARQRAIDPILDRAVDRALDGSTALDEVVRGLGGEGAETTITVTVSEPGKEPVEVTPDEAVEMIGENLAKKATSTKRGKGRGKGK